MTKIKLNLRIPIIDELGKVTVPGRNVGSALAQQMLQSGSNEETEIYKIFDWALTLGKGDRIDLNEGDAKMLRKWIVDNKELFILVKAPALKAIDALDFKRVKKIADKEE